MVEAVVVEAVVEVAAAIAGSPPPQQQPDSKRVTHIASETPTWGTPLAVQIAAA